MRLTRKRRRGVPRITAHATSTTTARMRDNTTLVTTSEEDTESLPW